MKYVLAVLAAIQLTTVASAGEPMDAEAQARYNRDVAFLSASFEQSKSEAEELDFKDHLEIKLTELEVLDDIEDERIDEAEKRVGDVEEAVEQFDGRLTTLEGKAEEALTAVGKSFDLAVAMEKKVDAANAQADSANRKADQAVSAAAAANWRVEKMRKKARTPFPFSLFMSVD